MDIDQLLFATEARVSVRATDSALLALAHSRAPDRTVFDTYPPFFFESEISSDRLDSFFTVMDPLTTLPNYARDAAAGVAVLVGHDVRTLPIGQSLSGTLEAAGDVTRVRSDAYILQEPDTLAPVSRIRAGIAKDISVGFSGRRSGAKCICSICGLDMWHSWDCWHIPGFEYEVDTEPTKGGNGAKRMVLCTGLIVNASLAEYSLVYDGSTPGAAVLQAQKAAEAGRMTIDQARLLEQRYRINLPGKRLQVTGGTMPPEHNGKVLEPVQEVRDLQAVLERAGVPSDRTVLQGVQWLADEVQRLTPLAKDGEQYRKDLVDAGVAEAVRAFGAETGEKKRALLDRSDLETIKEMTASWRDIGDAKLGGGRQTIDGAPPDESFTWKQPEISGLSQA